MYLMFLGFYDWEQRIYVTFLALLFLPSLTPHRMCTYHWWFVLCYLGSPVGLIIQIGQVSKYQDWVNSCNLPSHFNLSSIVILNNLLNVDPRLFEQSAFQTPLFVRNAISKVKLCLLLDTFLKNLSDNKSKQCQKEITDLFYALHHLYLCMPVLPWHSSKR